MLVLKLETSTLLLTTDKLNAVKQTSILAYF